MSLQLYAHPFSSYCQKVLIAFHENAIPHELRLLAPEEGQHAAEFARLWPIQRMPLLSNGARTVMESTCIIEYLALHHPGPVALIPTDAEAALQARVMDRIFDHYVMTPMQRIVFDRLRPEGQRDAFGVAEARALLETSYRWLDVQLQDRRWAIGDDFTLADCAAAPALFYADWVQPIPQALTQLRGYRQRLLARPSFARIVDEARPYRVLFPGGAPDRD